MRRVGIGFLWMAAVAALVVAGMGCGGSRPKATGEPEPDVTETPGETTPGETTPPTNVEEDPVTILKREVQDIFFDFDKYNLRQDSRRILQDNARVLKQYPGVQVVLEGHCDERGTNEYNLALGQRRADAVMAYLNDLGVPASQMSTISYGEERPFDTRHDEAGWALNRRVHFQFR